MWRSRFVILLCVSVGVFSGENVMLDIPQGSLKGLKAATITSNKPYFSFKGIPFAKSMIGDEKFNQPQPPEPWTDTLDATQHKAKCPYYCLMQKGIMGDEDCLYLNVYSTELNKDAKKAVLVWFPSGGYNAGSGNDDMYGPDFFMDQDVILVTSNYRIGAIGFLNTEDDSAPGNAGMKDQTMVLRWIRDNIQYFGGDPAKVTIFGHSSGAGSVQLHLLSPMSKGLFKGAIMQSGASVAGWSLNRKPKETAFKLGKLLGVNAKTSKELLDGLKKKSAGELITATDELGKEMNMLNGQMHAFVPSIEASVGQEVFLANDPWVLVKSGDLEDVPIMFGSVSDEASIFAPLMMPHAQFFNDHFENAIPEELNMTDAAKRKELAAEIKTFYLKDKPISPETAAEFTQLLSDVFFNIPTVFSNKVIAARNKSPVYQYLFTYEAPFGIMKNLFGLNKTVAHGDETGYEFYSTAFKYKPEPGSPSEKVMKQMTKMWGNFAKDGNPTSQMDPNINVQWEPMGKEDKYMNINADLKMEQGSISAGVSFWAKKYTSVLGDYSSVV